MAENVKERRVDDAVLQDAVVVGASDSNDACVEGDVDQLEAKWIRTLAADVRMHAAMSMVSSTTSSVLPPPGSNETSSKIATSRKAPRTSSIGKKKASQHGGSLQPESAPDTPRTPPSVRDLRGSAPPRVGRAAILQSVASLNLLHEYNDTRDRAHEVIAQIALHNGVAVADVHRLLGAPQDRG
jgi:hypothetical protein